MYQSTWAMNEVMRTFLISDTGYPDNLTWVLI
jgi:hypothetical protein